MKRKLMMVSMMAILSLSLFACGSKDTTSSSNGSARTNTAKEADTKNSISDSTDSDTIAMIALDDAYREISGTTSEGGEELDPDYLNSVQDQVNAAKDYIINEINTKLAEQGGIAKPRYGFSVYTDASGNNVDKETLALERGNWIEVSSTNKIKSGDVYDSYYSGFMANDGKYYLMRMSDDMAFAFDEIGADGISVDEDVVFE